MSELRDGYSLRKAELSDLGVLIKIEDEVTPFPWRAKQFADSISSHNGHVLLKGRRVIGYLFYQQILDQAELLNIAVRPSFQGEGFGAHLLNFCIECLSTSTAHLHLEVRASNFTAIELYQRAGFKQVGQRRAYYRSDQGREDALLMTYYFSEVC